MNLGDLRFTAEDFIKYNSLQHDGKGTVQYPSILADAVNRILAEKLEKARIVSRATHSWYENIQKDSEFYKDLCTHTARLVCVEPVSNAYKLREVE